MTGMAGYEYASGRIAALDSRLPSKTEVQNASQNGLDSLIRLFSSAALLPQSAKPSGIQELRRMCEEHLRDELLELCPDKRLFDILWLDGDLTNVKLLIKIRLLGLDPDSETLAIGTVPDVEVKAAVAEKDYSVFGDIADSISEVESLVESGEELMAVCARLDEIFIEKQRNSARSLGYKAISSYYMSRAETADILTAVRCQNLQISKADMAKLLIGPNKEKISAAYESAPESLVDISPDSIRKYVSSYVSDRDISKLSEGLAKVRSDTLSGAAGALEGPAAIVSYFVKVHGLMNAISIRKEERS
ncbi:MAG: V-type ATPase subunit [Oscillospiraceae bacterium]|jgi:vacuolar-type H+-ATPase subunit C/Vma6